MDITVRALTLECWPALEDLFGRAGASNGCWYMYWRIGPRYHDRPRIENRDDLPVWSLPCFYVRRTHRGRGVMDALIEAAVPAAAAAAAPAR